MAVSGKVYAKSDFSVGIINKNATAFETAAQDDAAYELLPVINVSAPVLNLVESGEIRSNNAGMLELDIVSSSSSRVYSTLDTWPPYQFVILPLS